MEPTLCQNEIINEPSKMSAKSGGNVKNDFTTITENKNVKGSNPIIKNGSVYLITNLINNKKYVGVTKNTIETRFKQHIKASTNSLNVIDRVIKRYGKENFKIELIEKFPNITEKNLLLKETFYIDKYNTLVDNGCGYNMIRCHKGHLIFSEETKRKMSLNHADTNGEKNPFYGKTHTKETKDKHSQWMKKYKSGKNHPMYGNPRPKNTRRKISLSLKGKCIGEKACHFDKTIWKFRNIHTNEKFIGYQYTFGKTFGLGNKGIGSIVTGRKKSYKGWVVCKA